MPEVVVPDLAPRELHAIPHRLKARLQTFTTVALNFDSVTTRRTAGAGDLPQLTPNVFECSGGKSGHDRDDLSSAPTLHSPEADHAIGRGSRHWRSRDGRASRNRLSGSDAPIIRGVDETRISHRSIVPA